MMVLLDTEALNYLVLVLGVLTLMTYAITFSLVLISCVWSWLYLHHKPDTSVLGDDVPGVSIVKPLMGLDPLLEENLESHFTLKYPKYELLICFHDDQDPAINLVQNMMAKFPKVDAKLFFHGRDDIMNPMVQNMVQGYDAAQYEYVWISTSRIKAATEIVEDMVVKLQQPHVALVHQMPFALQTNSVASSIEKIYFGGALARFYIAFNVLGLSCVTGMSYIFKKSLLDSLNGLGWFGKYLAEDFFLTRALHDRGFKLVMSAYPAQQNVSSTSIMSFIDRMVRWLRLRLNMLTVVASLIEPLTECLVVGATTAAALHHFFSINPLLFYTAHLAIWMVIDYIQLGNIQGSPVTIGKLRFAWMWVFRECMSVWIFMRAICNPHRIKWGRRTYYVHTGGHTELDTKNTKSLDL